MQKISGHYHPSMNCVPRLDFGYFCSFWSIVWRVTVTHWANHPLSSLDAPRPLHTLGNDAQHAKKFSTPAQQNTRYCRRTSRRLFQTD